MGSRINWNWNKGGEILVENDVDGSIDFEFQTVQGERYGKGKGKSKGVA